MSTKTKIKHDKTMERLIKVQEIDLKIRGLQIEMNDFYRQTKEEDPKMNRLKRYLAEIDGNISTIEDQHHMYVSTLEDIRTAIAGLSTTKSGAFKPRTRSSTEALRIEEEKLAVLVDETQKQVKDLGQKRAEIFEQIKARAKEVESSQSGPELKVRNIKVKIKRLEKQRTAAVKGMPSILIRKYDRLRQSRSGIGLTKLNDGVCEVCHMQMPTSIISRMLRGEQIPFCPACGRMVAIVMITDKMKHIDVFSPQFVDEDEKEDKEKPVPSMERVKESGKSPTKKRQDSPKPAAKKPFKKTTSQKPTSKKAARKK